MSPPPQPSLSLVLARISQWNRKFLILRFNRARSGAAKIAEKIRQLAGKIRSQSQGLWSRLRALAASRARVDRTLQRQLGLILVGMSLAFAGGNWVLQSQLIMPTFASLERQGAVRDTNRCLAGINRDLEMLSNQTNDWAAWDDTYQFVQDRNEKFREANLMEESFPTARVALIAMLNTNRELVWGECRNLETLEKIELPALWTMLTDEASPLTRHENVDDGKRGLVLTGAGPMLIACNPVITSKRGGPIRGSMIMGRFLNREEIDDLARRAEVDLAARTLDGSVLPETETKILDELVNSREPVIQVADAKSLLAYSKVDDLYGKPALLLRVKVPREVTAQGNFAGTLATWGGILGSLAITAGAGLLIRRRVVRPIEAIVAHARHIGEESDLKARLNSGRIDEIGQLSGAFDQMVESLSVSRKKVLEAAHQAGMADVASEVLHNVGNVINSAKTSVEQLEAQMKSSNLDGLHKAAGLLKQNSERVAEFFSQDPRGPKLVQFLVKTDSLLEEEAAANQGSLARVAKSIRHIQDIIALQEHRAHQAADYACETDLAEMFREVVTLNHDRLERAGIEVRVDAERLPEPMLNRSKLSQVLVNLVRNAIQAMEASGEGPRVLSLLARQAGDRAIEIEIRDTGCGMSEEVKANLFRPGFTTKSSGQGIGLHYCANAIRSMGGSVSASSEGPGGGASFHIRFPGSATGREQMLPAKAA